MTNQELIASTVSTMGKTDLVKEETFTPAPPEVITTEQVQQAVELLKDPEANGGDVRISKQVGISRSLLRQIKQAISTRLMELAQAEV